MGRISFTDAYYGVQTKLDSHYPEYYQRFTSNQIRDIDDYQKLKRSLTELYIEAYTDLAGNSPSVDDYFDIEINLAFDIMDDIKNLREKRNLSFGEILSILFTVWDDSVQTKVLIAISVLFIVLHFSISVSEQKRLEDYAFYDLIDEIIRK